MTTATLLNKRQGFRSKSEMHSSEKRSSRRYDLQGQTLIVSQWDSERKQASRLGYLLDLSAGGIRIRSNRTDLTPSNHIRVRIELPNYAGICPFVEMRGNKIEPKTEWIGWLEVGRVRPVSETQVDVAGRLIDMTDIDRGMLGLYLSTQPMAA